MTTRLLHVYWSGDVRVVALLLPVGQLWSRLDTRTVYTDKITPVAAILAAASSLRAGQEVCIATQR